MLAGLARPDSGGGDEDRGKRIRGGIATLIARMDCQTTFDKRVESRQTCKGDEHRDFVIERRL